MQNHAPYTEEQGNPLFRVPSRRRLGNRNLLNFKAQLEIIRGRFALFDSEEVVGGKQ